MPVVIDITPTASIPVISVAELARQLGISDSNLHRYIRKLRHMGHRCFPLGETGSGLSDAQDSVIRRYRFLSHEKGLRGDALIDAINAYPPPPDDRPARLLAEYERIGIPEDLLEETLTITLEVINETA